MTLEQCKNILSKLERDEFNLFVESNIYCLSQVELAKKYGLTTISICRKMKKIKEKLVELSTKEVL